MKRCGLKGRDPNDKSLSFCNSTATAGRHADRGPSGHTGSDFRNPGRCPGLRYTGPLGRRLTASEAGVLKLYATPLHANWALDWKPTESFLSILCKRYSGDLAGEQLRFIWRPTRN